jgi:murein DD-endopeptidase MepM/ murein hydrolase activator NlpD
MRVVGISLLLGAVLVSLAASAPAAETIRYEIYQVRSGDTVENIAARFGVDAGRLRRLNGLSEETAVTPGQSLAVVLPADPEADQQTAASAGDGSAQPQELAPRFAVTTGPCQITKECGGGAVLYELDKGARIVVKCEEGDYWGVVMQDGSIGWIAKPALQMTAEGLAPDRLEAMLQGGRGDIVEYATRYLGMPYRYGGRLPDNVDCSLFVQTVFAANGIKLPRTAHAQAEVGQPVSWNQLQPGDRLLFANRSGYINHTGIYMGGWRFIHASSYDGCVAVDSLTNPHYWASFAGARRP